MAQVYVNTDSMHTWKTEMEKINQGCVDEIRKIETSMATLNSSFQGDYASKYEDTFGQYTKKVLNSHESLKDVESFLSKVVQVMNNQ